MHGDVYDLIYKYQVLVKGLSGIILFLDDLPKIDIVIEIIFMQNNNFALSMVKLKKLCFVIFIKSIINQLLFEIKLFFLG